MSTQAESKPVVQRVDNTPPPAPPPAASRESLKLSDPAKMAAIRARYNEFRAVNAQKLATGAFIPVGTSFVDEMGWLIDEVDRLAAQ